MEFQLMECCLEKIYNSLLVLLFFRFRRRRRVNAIPSM